MKKIIALLLAAVMVLGLAACAGKPADTTPSGDTKPADTKATESTTKATEPAAAATGSVYYLNFKPELTKPGRIWPSCIPKRPA